MIGNDMFDEFVKPELEKTSARLSNAWYHLDGIGELKHLDSLLTVDTIKGIQWVPGEGEPRTRDWSEVYAKISKAKRKIQAYYDLDFHLDEILQVIERPGRSRQNAVRLFHRQEKRDRSPPAQIRRGIKM